MIGASSQEENTMSEAVDDTAAAPVRSEELGEGVIALHLHRPPVNALNPAFLDAIHAALDPLEASNDVRAVVIAGVGKVLSAGMDLKELQSFGVDEQCAMVHGLNRTFGRLYGFPKPVICAAHGAAIAGGLFVVLVSDYRVAGERARFGLAEMRVGVEFPVGPMVIARGELGASACRRLMLGGASHDAATALALGVVDEVVATDEVMARATAVAREYATLPPRTYAATKRALRAQALARIDAAVAAEAARPPGGERSGWFSDETLEATRAVLASLGKEKRR
jgi:enoyl-CoA hydratase/carnithine racemase